MTTKGYSSYHGRMSGRKIALIVVLALVLVGAVAYLVLQNYVVYDESGNAKIEVPFFQKKEKKEQQELRAEYVADFRKSLKVQLDNTVVINPDGSSYKLKQDKK